MKGLIGKKVGMTQVFDESGNIVPVTLIEAGPCYVTIIRHPKRDHYKAVQLGFGEAKPKHLSGGQLGHLKRNDLPPLRYLREFRVKSVEDLKEGDQLKVDIFQVGDQVDITGISKGKGFAGGIKRHRFHRGPKTHGQSDRERAPGSAGAGSTPGRVFKGKKMPGRLGTARVTSQNIRVVLVDPERNLLGVRGSVPGARGSVVVIKEIRKQ